MLYICYDRGLIKQFKFNSDLLRSANSEYERNLGLIWKCDHQIDKNNSIIRFLNFSDDYIFGLAEKGIIFVFNVAKSDLNKPYTI